MANPRRNGTSEVKGDWVYCTRVWHWRAKRYIYPKRSRYFRFRRRR